jgi:hypothetical protein
MPRFGVSPVNLYHCDDLTASLSVTSLGLVENNGNNWSQACDLRFFCSQPAERVSA